MSQPLPPKEPPDRHLEAPVNHPSLQLTRHEEDVAGKFPEVVTFPRSLARTRRLYPMLAAAAAAACYLNILPNDYCYDDVPIVQENPLIQAPGQWAKIWRTDYWEHAQQKWANRDLLYRPVSLTSYRVVRMLAGPAAWPQHAVNITLHALTSAMIVILARRLQMSERISLTAGLIFAVMPIHSEAVASVVGRADLLAALFIILALLAYAAARRAENVITRLVLYAATAIVAFGAANSKESGVAVFPILVVWDWLLGATDSSPKGNRRWLHTTTRVVWIALPLFIYAGMRYGALEGRLLSEPQLTKTINLLVDTPPARRALGLLQAWGMYWGKTFWPRELCINYSINTILLARGWSNIDVLIGIAAALSLAAVAVWATLRKQWLMLLAPAALVLCYLPGSNALKLIQVFFAERIWYLPSAFAAILLAWLFKPLLHFRAGRIIGCVILIVGGLRIWNRSYDWRNNGTLFAAAYAAHPDGVQPLSLYGTWLTQHGRLDEGIALLEKAVTIDPGYTDAHRALSQAYLAAEKPGEAIEHTQVAEMQAPGDEATKSAHEHIAAALEEENRQALNEAYLAAVKNPDDVLAHLQLALLLRDIGRVDESVQLMQANERRFAKSAGWHAELAINFVLLNRVDQAIAHYRQSLALEENAQTAVELAMLLLERRGRQDLQEADILSSLALRLATDAPHALVCRAEVLAQKGDLEEAQELYRRAIESTPRGDPRRRQFMERARAIGLSFDD